MVLVLIQLPFRDNSASSRKLKHDDLPQQGDQHHHHSIYHFPPHFEVDSISLHTTLPQLPSLISLLKFYLR